MREISYTRQFERDYKRLLKNPSQRKLQIQLETIIEILQGDQPLPEKYQDHPLAGEYKDYRECHAKPDLLLIYSKLDEKILTLVRLGSHSDLF